MAFKLTELLAIFQDKQCDSRGVKTNRFNSHLPTRLRNIPWWVDASSGWSSFVMPSLRLYSPVRSQTLKLKQNYTMSHRTIVKTYRLARWSKQCLVPYIRNVLFVVHRLQKYCSQAQSWVCFVQRVLLRKHVWHSKHVPVYYDQQEKKTQSVLNAISIQQSQRNSRLDDYYDYQM